MKKFLLIANWKNKPISEEEAMVLLRKLAKKKALYKKLNTIITPPWTHYSLREKIRSFASLASQDIFLDSGKVQTGAITADILKNFGVKYVILGHSERRAAGETSSKVAKKARLSVENGIIPIICIGESVRDEEGEHFEFLREELRVSLEGMRREDVRGVVIAYEPIWAIGKRAKDAITAQNLSEIVIFIKKILSDAYGRETAEKTTLVYGGSVEPRNAAEFVRQTRVNGFLVGHASLDADSFNEIAAEIINQD